MGMLKRTKYILSRDANKKRMSFAFECEKGKGEINNSTVISFSIEDVLLILSN